MNLKITIVLLALFGALGPSFAHSGGTDASGCHYNHQTGDYHCH
ncbi:MAG: YHYH domain-containing protein [Rhizobium giardinii]